LSVLNQTYLYTRVLLYDNCSKKPIRIFIDNNFSGKHIKRIKIIRSDISYTLTQARIKAISYSDADFFMYLDSDDSIDQNKIKDQLFYLDEKGKDIVGCLSRIKKISKKTSIYFPYWGNKYVKSELRLKQAIRYRPIFLSSILFRGKVKEIITQIPDKYNHSFDDYLIFLLIKKYGSIPIIQEEMFKYVFHDSNLSLSQRLRSKFESLDVLKELDLDKLYPEVICERNIDIFLAAIYERKFKVILKQFIFLIKKPCNLFTIIMHIYRRVLSAFIFRSK